MKNWKCEICGYVAEGDIAPEVCPACGAGSEVFSETDGKNVDPGMKQWLCLFCGYVYETDKAPELCPECQAKGSGVFVEYVAQDKQMAQTGNMYRCKSCGLVQFSDEMPEECPACAADAFISRTEWFAQRAK